MERTRYLLNTIFSADAESFPNNLYTKYKVYLDAALSVSIEAEIAAANAAAANAAAAAQQPPPAPLPGPEQLPQGGAGSITGNTKLLAHIKDLTMMQAVIATVTGGVKSKPLAALVSDVAGALDVLLEKKDTGDAAKVILGVRKLLQRNLFWDGTLEWNYVPIIKEGFLNDFKLEPLMEFAIRSQQNFKLGFPGYPAETEVDLAPPLASPPNPYPGVLAESNGQPRPRAEVRM